MTSILRLDPSFFKTKSPQFSVGSLYGATGYCRLETETNPPYLLNVNQVLLPKFEFPIEK